MSVEEQDKVEFLNMREKKHLMLGYNHEFNEYWFVLFDNTRMGYWAALDINELKQLHDAIGKILDDGEKVANDKISI